MAMMEPRCKQRRTTMSDASSTSSDMGEKVKNITATENVCSEDESSNSLLETTFSVC